MSQRRPAAALFPSAPRAAGRRITIGYVPLTDCAPLVVARELGLFERHGLDVRLSREAGWATVREKMLHGELDAAHAPASMVFEMSHGLGGVAPVPALTGLVLAHHGNAIVLSNELRGLGATDAASLRAVVEAHRGRRRFTFAGVLVYSSQHYLMRDWLRSGGIDPDRDVDLVVVPPPLVADCMEQGHLDGYCVAEPWSSVGLLRGVGHGVALSADLAPMHPEKIFMVRADFERDRPEEHLRLLAALIEAGRWCDRPANRAGLATLLSSPAFLGVSVSSLKNALLGPYHLSPGRTTRAEHAILFHHEGIDRPAVDKARWVVDAIRRQGLGRDLPALSDPELAALFRADLYDRALPLANLLGPAPAARRPASPAAKRPARRALAPA
jgi:ABC-type nitrate/sulfonate/bicarbonate transport system substrate-binding protein